MVESTYTQSAAAELRTLASAQMRILHESDRSLRMERAELGEGHALGDVCWHVVVEQGEFRGERREVWTRAEELTEFFRQLEELDRSLDDCALLEAMSPNEFRLELRMADALGHIQASGYLAQPLEYLASEQGGRIAFSFIVEPNQIRPILEAFRGLVRK